MFFFNIPVLIPDFKLNRHLGKVNFNICPTIQKLFQSHENTYTILNICAYKVQRYKLLKLDYHFNILAYSMIKYDEIFYCSFF